MKRLILLCCCTCLAFIAGAQQNIEIKVTGADQQPLPFSSIELLGKDSSVLLKAITDSSGFVVLKTEVTGDYLLRASRVDHVSVLKAVRIGQDVAVLFVLPVASKSLAEVTVTAKQPLIKQVNGKTIVNVEGSINATGSSILEVLERTPGVTVDKDGNIALRGRPDVLVMIDGKMTYVSGADLATMLGGMSSSQVESIELMEHPPASFDAAGNAGIINIRTKKTKQKGTNVNLSLGVGQGVYSKTNNSIGFTHRSGSIHVFANYSYANAKGYTDLYALRTYFPHDGVPALQMEQPTYIRYGFSTHNIRAGMDYYLQARTSIGFALGYTNIVRQRNGESIADWLKPAGGIDSSISTISNIGTNWLNKTGNLNLRHQFRNKNELSVDFDYLLYDISNTQHFNNRLLAPNGYEEKVKGNLPSDLKIAVLKADYTNRVSKTLQWAAGIKGSRTKTDNFSAFQLWNNNQWEDDLNRSNHFLYTENILAGYVNENHKSGRWTTEAGLRFEHTAYDANQLGNAAGKDSAFSRNYSSLFPSASISYQVDSANSFSLHAGRRIDRPPFQKLNPFTTIINKYTYQAGNPLILPQYTWNLELVHQYKELLTTTIGYHLIRNYFTQYFYSTAEGLIVYSDGNIGKMNTVSVASMLQLQPLKNWNLVLDITYNYKVLDGFVWTQTRSTIHQVNFNLSNQFRFGKKWTGEMSAYYITRHQNDFNEVLDPTGQLGLGIARQILQSKGNLKLAYRDVFYTQRMAGNTAFQHAHEYFWLKGDSRVLSLSFSYRFTKGEKVQQRKLSGSEEAERVSN